ncbi:MAG: hypothetical protein K2J38_03850 [Muribaculaceae bacterium]|nr:hypothetical protein [Muribaculaceae bacterium]
MIARVYIEAGSAKTPEHVFVRTLLRRMGFVSGSHFEIIAVGGKDNLPNVINKLTETELEGGRNIIVFDADSPENGGGYDVRKSEIEAILAANSITAGLFLFPDDSSDGDFETLLERIAQTESHKLFFGCFSDYESCVGRDYLTPNRKGKLHTYVTAQKWLSKKQRDAIGKGEWLFEDTRLWNLDSPELGPLKDFFVSNIVGD